MSVFFANFPPKRVLSSFSVSMLAMDFLMKKAWIAYVPVVLVLVGFVLGCEPKTTKPSPSQTGTATKIVARVGNLVLSQGEFVQAYQQWGRGQTPEQFLQNMVRERLFQLEAERLRIQDTAVVQQTLYKGMIRTLLRRDFERWFTPDAIDILKVRKYYHENSRRYYRPTLAQVAHLLVRLPSNPRRQAALSPLEKSLLDARTKEAETLAQEFLRQVQQQSPRNKQEFIKLATAFVTLHNTTDPNLIAWYQSWSREMLQSPEMSKIQRVQTLEKALQQLDSVPFCDMCDHIRAGLRKLISTWSKQRNPNIAAIDVQKKLEPIKKLVMMPRRRVTTEDLPPFPERSVPNWPSMVDEFAQAAFALNDKQYSHTLCKTAYGYHILFREKTLPSFRTPLLQVAPKIRRILFEQERVKRYKQWLHSKYKGIKMVGYFSRLQDKPKPKK